MADLLTFEQVQTISGSLKNYVDKNLAEGYQLNGDDLLYRESNELIIGGLNSTINQDGTVDGISISGGYITLDDSVLNTDSSITLKKATGIYKDYQLAVADSLPVFTQYPKSLSVDNGVLQYNSDYDTEGYILNNNQISYGFDRPQVNCTIAGLFNSLTADDNSVDGIAVNYDSLSISSNSFDSSSQVTIDSDNTNVFLDSPINVSVASPNTRIFNNSSVATIYANDSTSISISAGSSSNLTLTGGKVFNNGDYPVSVSGSDFAASLNNANVSLTGNNDSVTIYGGSNCSFNTGNYPHYINIDRSSLDVQLFADGDESPTMFGGASSAETVSVFATYATSKKSGSNTTKRISGKGTHTVYGGVNANSGNDYISVTADAINLSIAGGADDDIITIEGGERTGGNYYVYRKGDGKDSIFGWNKDHDTLLLDSANYNTIMSTDGNAILVQNNNGGYTAFYGLNHGDAIKVSIQGVGASTVTVQKIMQGTTFSESIFNGVENPYDGADSIPDHYAWADHSGTPDDIWTINGDKGSDLIRNANSYVSIYGGDGNDTIKIEAKDGSVTSGVTIKGGVGNDVIDVTEDTVVSNGVTVYGAHTYQYTVSDGYDSIFGFNENDSIIFSGFADSQIANIKSSVSSAGVTYLIAHNSNIYFFPDHFFTIDNQFIAYDSDTSISTVLDSSSCPSLFSAFAPVSVDGTFDHYEIPKDSAKQVRFYYNNAIAKGTDTISGYNPDIDLIYINNSSADVSLDKINDNLVATFTSDSGTVTLGSILFDDLSAGTVRFRIGKRYETYTISE